MYGIKTIQECFAQSPSSIVSPITSCKGHWLQLATTISVPYSLLRRQHLDQEEFPAQDAIQGYLLGVYTRVTVLNSSFFCIFVVNFDLTLYLYVCCYGLRLSKN